MESSVSAPSASAAGREPGSVDEVTRFVVGAAVWAPSVHNTQPWRFAHRGRQISLSADVERRLAVADPEGREMMISCGAALFTARLALRSAGYRPDTSVLPDPDRPALVARIGWEQAAPASEYEQQLFAQVMTRRTHRGGFDPAPLPAELVAALREEAARDGARLHLVGDDGGRATLAAVTEVAEHALRLDDRRALELARWAPAPGSPRRDGVPHSAYPARPERTDPDFPGRDYARGRGWGYPPAASAPLLRSAGDVALLTTPGDTRADWVNAGQALQRVMLTATLCGAAVALHSQPLEFPHLREFLRDQICGRAYPHMVVRLGTTAERSVSVRRPVGDVLI